MKDPPTGINRVEIDFSRSGAVDNIRWHKQVPDGGTTLVLCATSVLSLIGMRRCIKA